MTKVILASSSPRRRDLLTGAGIRFCVADPPEDAPLPDGMPIDLGVQLLARLKAVAVAKSATSEAFVLGADTMVFISALSFGKPKTPQRALEMLRTLSGTTHVVHTGMCAISTATGKEALALSRTKVRLRTLTDSEIEAYVASGEPLDKAGGYAIHQGARDFVEAVQGRVDTVMGLDVQASLNLLADVGYPDPLPSAVDVCLAPVRVPRPLATTRSSRV